MGEAARADVEKRYNQRDHAAKLRDILAQAKERFANEKLLFSLLMVPALAVAEDVPPWDDVHRLPAMPSRRLPSCMAVSLSNVLRQIAVDVNGQFVWWGRGLPTSSPCLSPHFWMLNVGPGYLHGPGAQPD